MAYNLEFDSLTFQLDGPNLKVYTDSGDVAFGISVICKTQKQTGL
jgi:hypothetical protein